MRLLPCSCLLRHTKPPAGDWRDSDFGKLCDPTLEYRHLNISLVQYQPTYKAAPATLENRPDLVMTITKQPVSKQPVSKEPSVERPKIKEPVTFESSPGELRNSVRDPRLPKMNPF